MISNKICSKRIILLSTICRKSSNFEHMPPLVKHSSSYGYELNSILKIFRTKCFLIKENSSFDGFSANRTFGHSISAHLTGSMPTQENHVLQTIQTHWAHCLEKVKKCNVRWCLQTTCIKSICFYLFKANQICNSLDTTLRV